MTSLSKSIIIYASYIPKVGGIESMTYNLAVALHDKGANVTLVYNNVENAESLLKLGRFVKVKKLTDETIHCDICLLSSNHPIPDRIQAKRYVQWIHSDYKKYNITLRNIGRVSNYVAVSNHCKEIACELYPAIKDITTTIYNFPDPKLRRQRPQPLKLVTVSRLSPEKGMERVRDLAKRFKENDIPFLWTIVGDNSHSRIEEQKWRNTFLDIEEVSFVGFKSDPTPYVLDSDYSCLLSDFEGCPVSLLEALGLGVPVITTCWGGSDEIVKQGVNGYIVPMDISELSDEDIKQMYNKIPQVKNEDLRFADQQIGEWVKLLESE